MKRESAYESDELNTLGLAKYVVFESLIGFIILGIIAP